MSRTSTTVDEPRPSRGPVGRAKAIPAYAQRLVERARARSSGADVLVRTFKRYSEDDCGSYAAALTYYAFFAIFPLLLFAAAGVGYVTFGNQELADKVIRAGIKGIPMIKDALTPDGLVTLQENKDTIAGIGLILALYTGTGMIVALEHSLNKVHRLEEEGNWFQKRSRAVGWLALLGVAAAGSLTMTSMAAAFDGAPSKILSYAGAFAIDIFIFATAFKFLTAVKLSWKEVLPGALVAAIAFSLLKGFGTAYLAQGSSTRNATYGTLAGAATLLVASYLISQVILLAAEVNATLIERRATRTKASDRTEEGA
jgi:YihY family inner membrane protein